MRTAPGSAPMARVARLLAPAMLAALAGCGGPAAPSGLSDTAKAFLQDNRSALDLSEGDDFTSWSRLDRVTPDHDLFLSGEYHGTSVSLPLKLKMLRYLNQREGVRIYLDELGYGASLLVARYLRDGDEAELRFLMNALAGTDSHNGDTLTFWRRLRQLNQRLPESRTIAFVGIDIDHQRDVGLYSLARLIPAASPDEPASFAGLRGLAAAFASHEFVSRAYEPGLTGRIPAVVDDVEAGLRADP